MECYSLAKPMTFNPELRILYVDDNADCCEMLSTLLGYSRIETQLANSAAQALSAMQAQRFDMYLLEAWLPGINGFELCGRMREANPDTPILFFSSAAYAADKVRGLEAGANDYVSKPQIEALLGSIAKYFPKANTVMPTATAAI
jgi:DNA-binding response OmpR family regulator